MVEHASVFIYINSKTFFYLELTSELNFKRLTGDALKVAVRHILPWSKLPFQLGTSLDVLTYYKKKCIWC